MFAKKRRPFENDFFDPLWDFWPKCEILTHHRNFDHRFWNFGIRSSKPPSRPNFDLPPDQILTLTWPKFLWTLDGPAIARIDPNRSATDQNDEIRLADQIVTDAIDADPIVHPIDFRRSIPSISPSIPSILSSIPDFAAHPVDFRPHRFRHPSHAISPLITRFCRRPFRLSALSSDFFKTVKSCCDFSFSIHFLVFERNFDSQSHQLLLPWWIPPSEMRPRHRFNVKNWSEKRSFPNF